MNDVRFEQVSTNAWNINCSYAIGTKVTYDGSTYVSKKNVPKGVNIGMSDYWKKMELADDVTELAGVVNDIVDNLNVAVSEVTVPFKFAYDSENGVYGFMVGEVFHPFGGEVIPSGEG